VSLLSNAYHATRALESVENYARSGGVIPNLLEQEKVPIKDVEYVYEGFWPQILRDPDQWWGTTFQTYDGALSEWIPRVPGLYWTQDAEKLRKAAEKYRVFESKSWTEFQPLGKSQKVFGGIGTIKLPDNAGYRLASISGGHNASAGVPVLISSEAWEYHKLKEGDIVNLKGKWQKMALGWVERFPSIRGIPRGYLVVDNPDAIEVRQPTTPIRFHPYTVMQYEQDGTLLYDFVFATADTGVNGWEKELRSFFEEYRAKNERHGEYLISADPGNPDPLWEAKFTTPEELQMREADAETHLELLQKRIREHSFRGKTLEELIDVLAGQFQDADDFRRLSEDIGIKSSLWYAAGRSSASYAARLVNECAERQKVEELLDLLSKENPGIFE
jgi:Effector-associated domain 1